MSWTKHTFPNIEHSKITFSHDHDANVAICGQSRSWQVTTSFMEPLGPYTTIEKAKEVAETLAGVRIESTHDLDRDCDLWSITLADKTQVGPFETRELAMRAMPLLLRLQASAG